MMPARLSHRVLTVTLAVVVSIALGLCTAGRAADEKKDLAAKEAEPPKFDKAAQAKRRPKTYLAIFINGYSGDPLPKAPKQFEKLLQAITTEGHFNAILCKYTPERLALCKKYKVRMVVDLLAFPHVYQNVKECEELLKKLQGDPTVAAYHLWADEFGSMGAGRTRDIRNVHKWDPTHATYIGTRKGHGYNYLAESDFISNYNFSWKRGPHRNFIDLIGGWKTARKHDNRLGRYCSYDPGLPGRGNPNRLLYIQTTSIACGLRAAMWHIGSGFMNMSSFQLNQYGKDLAKTNAYIEPMRDQIAKIGLPYAIYSTPWTKDWNNRDVKVEEGQKAYPPSLGGHAFPKDFWIQAESGEFVMGVSKYDYTDTDVVFIANHNAYAPQDVKLKITRPVKVEMFCRKEAKWKDMPLKDGTVSFKLEAAGGEMLKFEK